MSATASESARHQSCFSGGQFGAAELKLAYALDLGLEVAVVVGDPGLGKSTLLRRLTQRISENGDVAIDVFFSQLDVDDLLAHLDAELAAVARTNVPDLGSRRDARLRRISDRARRLAEDGCGVVCLIDDAHCIRNPAVFEALHLLLNLRQREQSRFTVVLAGQKSLLSDLARVPAFAQRVGITAPLVPYDTVTTADYVRHRQIGIPDGDAEQFECDATLAIHDHSGGIPRRIDRLCEMSQLIASLDGRRVVSRSDVEQAAGEMRLLVGNC